MYHPHFTFEVYICCYRAFQVDCSRVRICKPSAFGARDFSQPMKSTYFNFVYMYARASLRGMRTQCRTAQIRNFTSTGSHTCSCGCFADIRIRYHCCACGLCKSVAMPVPLSTDLRWRIVWLHHYKEVSNKDIADLLYVHITTVRRIIHLFDISGDVAPVNYKPGPKRMLLEPEE